MQLDRETYQKAAEELRRVQNALKRTSPVLSSKIGNDAQECELRARQLDVGLIP
jgi:hypothetical protein